MTHFHRWSRFFLLCLWLGSADGQTIQSQLLGTVQDATDDSPLAGVQVRCEELESGFAEQTRTNALGEYRFLALSPGRYRLRAEHPSYQPREVYGLELAVASQLQADLTLRPAEDVFERRLFRVASLGPNRGLVSTLGADIELGRDLSAPAGPFEQATSAPVVSTVISGQFLHAIPLSGRDSYSLLLLLPGVSSDAGAGRGLGLSVAGQRPTSATYLLDGLENTNWLTGGPRVSVNPEGIGEYRVSTAVFSSEYGGTAGFLANAVSLPARAGSHGGAYLYGRPAALAARDFRSRDRVVTDRRFLETQLGVSMSTGLPLAGKYLSFTAERLNRDSEGSATEFEMPTSSFAAYTTANSTTRSLLSQYAGSLPTSNLVTAAVTARPPQSVRRTYIHTKLDQTFWEGKLRTFGRVTTNRLQRPEFIWSPYPEFTSPLRDSALSAAGAAIWQPEGNQALEFRAGWGTDRIRWDRSQPQIPTLSSGITQSGLPVVLPGSLAAYGLDHRNNHGEVGLQWSRFVGRHVWKAGGQWLHRRNRSSLTFARDGRVLFDSILDFFLDHPSSIQASVERGAVSLQSPAYEGQFRWNQWAFFLQDQWRVTPSLMLTFGLRYENFGAPQLQGGTGIPQVRLDASADWSTNLQQAKWSAMQPGEALYSADPGNFAPRVGLTWRPRQRRSVVVRASYGVFHDRPIDNLWRNVLSNRLEFASARVSRFGFPYLRPIGENLRDSGLRFERSSFPEPILYQPGIRDAYAQSFFAGISAGIGGSWVIEWNGSGSLGRKLISTDRVNRPLDVSPLPGVPLQRPAHQVPGLSYRANQGASNYWGTNVTVRGNWRGGFLQAGYSWSHAIDNQSDALAGEYLDLSFTSGLEADPGRGIAAFSSETDSRADRGNSDFDQRHSLNAAGAWTFRDEGPARWLLSDWTVAGIGSLRSGLPYSIFAPANDDGPQLYNRRANLVGDPRSGSSSVSGQLLRPQAFAIPASGQNGNLGRNAFRAPSFWAMDFSLSKAIPVPRWRETAVIRLRADIYNLWNHANLDRPGNVVGSAAFGIVERGRRGRGGSFPASFPLDEASRQVQLMLRVEF